MRLLPSFCVLTIRRKLFPIGWGILGMLMTVGLHGQSLSSDNVFLTEKKVELGVNVTSVLFSALGNSNTSLDPGRFPWIVKPILNSGDAIRFGLGLNLKYENERFGGDLFRVFNNFASFRMGYEWRMPIEKRWLAYWGVDGIVDYQDEQVVSRTGNDFAIIRLESWGVGGGPVLGLQFAISDRIILGSEASFYGVYRIRTRTESFVNFQIDNEQTLTNQMEVNLTVPRWLYLSIRL